MRHLALVLLIVFPIISFSQSDAFPEGFTHRIVVIGSSTAAGHGPSVKDSAWVNRFRSYMKSFNPENEVINLAKGGYTTYHLMPDGFKAPEKRQKVDTLRNITRALAFYPTSIIINLPSNDAGWGYSNADQLTNYEIILEEARKENVPVWICSPQPRNFKEEKVLNQQNQLNKMMLKKYPNYIDFWNGFEKTDFSLRDEFNSGDGTHLNDEGHRILTERVIENKVWSDTTIDFFKSELIHFHDASLMSTHQSLPWIYETKELFEQHYNGWYNESRLFAKRTWFENVMGEVTERSEHITVIYDPKMKDHRGMGHVESTIYAKTLNESGEVTSEWVEVSLDIDYRTETTTLYYQPTAKDQIYRLIVPGTAIEEIDFLKKLCYFYASGSNSSVSIKVIDPEKPQK